MFMPWRPSMSVRQLASLIGKVKKKQLRLISSMLSICHVLRHSGVLHLLDFLLKKCLFILNCQKMPVYLKLSQCWICMCFWRWTPIFHIFEGTSKSLRITKTWTILKLLVISSSQGVTLSCFKRLTWWDWQAFELRFGRLGFQIRLCLLIYYWARADAKIL